MDWLTVSLIILAISVIFGWVMVKVKAGHQDTPVKVMLFVLYFWLSAFVQIVLAGVGYYLYGMQ